MSGKINPGSSSEEKKIKHVRSQQHSYETMSAATPPPLPSRNTAKSIPSYPAPKAPIESPVGPSQYDPLCPLNMQGEQNLYDQCVPAQNVSGSDINMKLRNIEDNQMRIRNEFNEFREQISKEIKSLNISVKRLMEMNDSLDESMRESFGFMQVTMEKMHVQLLENSDHLGKQILDIRRDIAAASKSNPGIYRPLDVDVARQTMKKWTHTFEWEVGKLESLLRHQQSTSSQSYLIGQIDFKILGGAVCTRDGRLSVKIYGEFTHMMKDPSERKNGTFQCAVFVVDKSGNLNDLLVGKVSGDFHKDKEWIIGDVSASEIDVKGYTARGGNVNLKYVIDVYA